MSPLPLPTDNLYKFVALTGAALLIASFIFPLTRLDDLELAIQQTSSQRKVLGVETSALEADVTQLDLDLKRLGAAVDAASRPASAMKEDAIKARERLHELSGKQLALAIKRAEIQGNDDKNTLLMKQIKRTWSYLKIGGFIGLLMTYVGFLLWYLRVQRPMDIEVRKKLD